MTQKSLIKRQISPIKSQNFEKPSRSPSKSTKVKILKKKNFGYLLKKFGSAYAQSPRKYSNIEILAKIEGKEAKFFSKIYEGHMRIWLRSKKNSKLSHACVPLKGSQYRTYLSEHWWSWDIHSQGHKMQLHFDTSLSIESWAILLHRVTWAILRSLRLGIWGKILDLYQ